MTLDPSDPIAIGHCTFRDGSQVMPEFLEADLKPGHPGLQPVKAGLKSVEAGVDLVEAGIDLFKAGVDLRELLLNSRKIAAQHLCQVGVFF